MYQSSLVRQFQLLQYVYGNEIKNNVLIFRLKHKSICALTHPSVDENRQFFAVSVDAAYASVHFVFDQFRRRIGRENFEE